MEKDGEEKIKYLIWQQERGEKGRDRDKRVEKGGGGRQRGGGWPKLADRFDWMRAWGKGGERGNAWVGGGVMYTISKFKHKKNKCQPEQRKIVNYAIKYQ